MRPSCDSFRVAHCFTWFSKRAKPQPVSKRSNGRSKVKRCDTSTIAVKPRFVFRRNMPSYGNELHEKAIDTVFTDFRDAPGFETACRVSRRRGFKGRMAIHPDQVAVINAAYSPSAQELAWAQRIVDAFAAQPDAGALSLDGAMIDLPHLIQARRTLASGA